MIYFPRYRKIFSGSNGTEQGRNEGERKAMRFLKSTSLRFEESVVWGPVLAQVQSAGYVKAYRPFTQVSQSHDIDNLISR